MAQKATARKMKSRQETTFLDQTQTRDVLKFRWATWDSPRAGPLYFTGSEHWGPFNNIFLRAQPCEGVQTNATCDIQQCWELLANNVVSVCTGLNIRTGLHVFKSDLSEQIPLFPLPTVAVGM